MNDPRRLAMVAVRKSRRSLIAAIGREGWTAEELSGTIKRLRAIRLARGADG